MNGEVRTTTATVAVVGYGPVGAAAAALLAIQGVDVVVVEPYAEVYPMPRAGGAVAESMRMFQRLGLADDLVKEMNEYTYFYDIFDKDWNKVVERSPDMGPRHQWWWHNYMFYQPNVEASIRHLCRRRGVQEKLGFKVTRIDEAADGSTLHISEVKGGAHEIVQAKYVIGCDGSRSIVRQSIGADMEDLGGDEAWVVVHLRVTDDSVKLPERNFEWANPNRAVTYITNFPKALKLFEFRVLPGENHADLVRPEKVWEFLKPWLTPNQAELVRVLVYVFHSRCARRWQSRRRMFIAGDAAHEMPPTLGEGLNSGFRDAMNLSWKLGGVIRGLYDGSILDTYQQERWPHTRAIVKLSHDLAVTIALVADDPNGYRTNLALDKVFRHPYPRLNPGVHGEAPAPSGTLSEQPELANGIRLDDHIGFTFGVIAAADILEHVCASTQRIWDLLQVKVVAADDPALEAWLQRLSARAVITRPDRWIYGVANDVDSLDKLAETMGNLLPASHSDQQ